MKLNKKVFIIAEAGVNHNGSIKTAKRMIDAAFEAGADAVKFQTFRAVNLARKDAKKAGYQGSSGTRGESQRDMLKKLELDPNAHKELMCYSGRRGIIFLSSPFDLESVDLLHRLGLGIIKMPSGEITNLPYLRRIGRLKKRVILSSGMADLKEIDAALNALIESGTPKSKITVLHCNTSYPTQPEDVNLKAMLTIRDRFHVAVGYSDHTAGAEVAVAAVALGASVIEKHFTLDRTMRGPDHRASLEPADFRAMVGMIRNVEKSLGDGIKRCTPPEKKNKKAVRKSIVASAYIAKGEAFSEDNLTTKRPAGGISPMEWDGIIGKSAGRDFLPDEVIRL